MLPSLRSGLRGHNLATTADIKMITYFDLPQALSLIRNVICEIFYFDTLQYCHSLELSLSTSPPPLPPTLHNTSMLLLCFFFYSCLLLLFCLVLVL